MIEGMPARGTRKAAATWEHIINDASIDLLYKISLKAQDRARTYA
jgi:hypothetical protein